MLFIERDHPVVEQIRGGDRRLAAVELGKADLGVGVDEGLLVDPPATPSQAFLPLRGRNLGLLRPSACRHKTCLVPRSSLGIRCRRRSRWKASGGFLVRLGLFQSGHLAFG